MDKKLVYLDNNATTKVYRPIKKKRKNPIDIASNEASIKYTVNNGTKPYAIADILVNTTPFSLMRVFYKKKEVLSRTSITQINLVYDMLSANSCRIHQPQSLYLDDRSY